MYAGPWRHVRSLTVSATCVALSAAGHLAGGGTAPDLTHAPVAALGLGVVTTLVLLVLAAASRRRWTFGRAVLALGLGQGALHLAFTLLFVPAAHPAVAGSMPGMAAGTPGRRPHDDGRPHGRGRGRGRGDRPHRRGAGSVAGRVDRRDHPAPRPWPGSVAPSARPAPGPEHRGPSARPAC